MTPLTDDSDGSTPATLLPGRPRRRPCRRSPTIAECRGPRLRESHIRVRVFHWQVTGRVVRDYVTELLGDSEARGAGGAPGEVSSGPRRRSSARSEARSVPGPRPRACGETAVGPGRRRGSGCGAAAATSGGGSAAPGRVRPVGRGPLGRGDGLRRRSPHSQTGSPGPRCRAPGPAAPGCRPTRRGSGGRHGPGSSTPPHPLSRQRAGPAPVRLGQERGRERERERARERGR